MAGVRYYNQTAPFWDWVASMEEQGSNHPFSNRNNQAGESSEDEQPRGNPWAEGWAGFPFGPFPHRGRHGPHHGPHSQPHRGPPGHRGPPPPPNDHDMNDAPGEKEHDAEEGLSEPRGPPPPFSFSEGPQHQEPGPHHGAGHHHSHGGSGKRSRCGGRGRGGFGGRGHGSWGHPAFGQMSGFGGLAEMFQNQIFGDNNDSTENKEESFMPEIDVFDTTDSFIVHVSLPGAKKEDVGVNWDSDKSELSIAGVVYRPGDEELLKTLALDERKAGMFERKVRLGSRANPAQVDVDSVSAKLEDGILRVDVPKLDAEYVDVKKVDIE